MTGTKSRIILRVTLACCVLAGCSGAEEAPSSDPDRTAAAIGGDSVFDPQEERVNLPTSRIYYTLTNHEWYAHGQPLIHEGRGFRPAGMPVGASLPEMTRAGEFQGVEYYVRAGDPTTVYVPVFDGYWQPFIEDPTARVSPADAAPAPDAPPDTVPPDSTAGPA